MEWYKQAKYDGTWTRIDYDRKAHQSRIQPTEEGFGVYNSEDNSYLLSFDSPEEAQEFSREYDEANLRRKGVSKVYLKFLARSLDARSDISEDSKILRLDPDAEFEQEQAERDLVLAPQAWHERRERYLKLRRHGLPHVPEVKDEVEEFRMKPSKPHGVELPAPRDVPDVPSVRDLKMREIPGKRPALIAFLKTITKSIAS